MANNSAKLWIQQSLNDTAIQRAQQAIRSTGRALPCSVVAVQGALVTVKFEVDSAPWTLPQITIPKAESQWVRMPTQVGDLGVTIPGDVSLAGVSGMGSGIANMGRRGNLATLVFLPLSNKNSPPIDQDAAQIEGPNGAIIRTSSGSASLTVNDDGITMSFGGKTVLLNGSGLTIDGVLFDTHTHLYAPGTGTPTETGGPQS
ncbi:hypothetical protein [Dyella mobilis]|uniref:Phage baseplate assembly protein V n=1 Tax=Dyella mobilis TaxID=1849582 RepID=A0ABS2KE03_9GAMM|nr:hypothetical protein [Dyella mobilis]MBM7129390.1 hypothetical protein [Dyella mobilis]GLQ98345.1 hypothetical protein GCM10007863_27650 [Dyella mobilis]